MDKKLFSLFDKFPQITIGLSQKQDGSMKLFNYSFENETTSQNRNKFFTLLGINSDHVVSAGLIHNSKIACVSLKNSGNIIKKTDGLLTNKKNLFLSITVADCLPVFLYDCQKKVIGLIHAGWRGLAQNILPKVIHLMTKKYKSNPKDILVGIGPGISSCHFEVQKDILPRFKNLLPQVLINRQQKTYLDLKKIAKLQLFQLGIKKNNIETSPDCTYCLKNKYFSYRRDCSKTIQAMAAVIGIKK